MRIYLEPNFKRAHKTEMKGLLACAICGKEIKGTGIKIPISDDGYWFDDKCQNTAAVGGDCWVKLQRAKEFDALLFYKPE